MNGKEESEYHIWWHPGLHAWAWLCWRCRTPGAGWSGQEPTWQEALEATEDHVLTHHHSKIQPDLPPPIPGEAAPAPRVKENVDA